MLGKGSSGHREEKKNQDMGLASSQHWGFCQRERISGRGELIRFEMMSLIPCLGNLAQDANRGLQNEVLGNIDSSRK